MLCKRHFHNLPGHKIPFEFPRRSPRRSPWPSPRHSPRRSNRNQPKMYLVWLSLVIQIA